MGRYWTFAHLGRQVGRIHREVPGSKGIWRIRPRSAHGLFEPFSRFLRIFPKPLHTREVAGSKPAAPISEEDRRTNRTRILRPNLDCVLFCAESRRQVLTPMKQDDANPELIVD